MLTTAGVTLISTSKIWAAYSYYSNGMKDSFIISTLSRAEKEVDVKTNTTYTDGTQDNPAYPIEIEIQNSKGFYQGIILTKRKPLIDISSALDGDITETDATISLSSSQGGEQFPSSGYIIVGSEVITYTGTSDDDLTGCTRGVLGTTAATDSNTDSVHSTIVFRSDTVEGTEVSWTIQPWQTSINANEDGRIYIYRDADPSQLYSQGVAERIKIIYFYGNDTVPGDITRLTLLYAKRALIQDNIGKAMIAGRNEFNPEMMNADEAEINMISNSHIVLSMGNT